MSKKALRAAVVAAFLALPGAASAAAVDYFLKIDGVNGESTDAGHKDWIEVESWSWGAAAESPGGSGRAGRACAFAFNFTKKVDKASPQLMATAVSGMHFKNAIITARKAGDKPQDYLKFTLEDVMVSSYQAGGSTSALPVDDRKGRDCWECPWNRLYSIPPAAPSET